MRRAGRSIARTATSSSTSTRCGRADRNPKDEVDTNTYDLFDLETGVPTDAYSLDEAVQDGFLVPPRGISVDLGFMHKGIKYDELSPEDKDDWDEVEWGEDEHGNPLAPPDEVDPAALNKILFNADTVDKVLERSYVGLALQGPEDIFPEDDLDRLFETLARLEPPVDNREVADSEDPVSEPSP